VSNSIRRPTSAGSWTRRFDGAGTIPSGAPSHLSSSSLPVLSTAVSKGKDMRHTISVPLGNRNLEIEIGKLAKQADGSAVVRFGDTVVLATAVFAKEPKENADFFPLTVDYRENTYAAGRIPGGWFKREGRPTEKEILPSRLIDRPFRPLFPKGFNHETQIIAFVLSADGQNDPDVLALNAASVALTCSLVPFYSPIGAVRVGSIGRP